ncbi:MAG: SOS response-associated peptidase [bacterium]|nr:SOS response-associated peptidase [bacterium]
MCGRINLTSAPHVLAERFYLDLEPDLLPRYNIAPGTDIAVVAADPRAEHRILRAMRWGLVPPWSEGPKAGRQLINARGETVREKPAFREAFARRRCLIPVNGFYEWRPGPGPRRPYLFRRPDADLFALAGLWETWRGPDGREVETCAIVTTAANEVMRPIHHRMPVILPAADWRLWCDLPDASLDQVAGLLKPAPADLLLAHPVSRRVNSPSCDEPDCLEAVDDDTGDQLDLFGDDDQGATA